jgi:hypothetical protein
MLLPSERLAAEQAVRDPADQHLAQQDHFRTKLHGLLARPLGEVGARYAVGKSEVVLDAGADAGLPSGHLALDDGGIRPSEAA